MNNEPSDTRLRSTQRGLSWRDRLWLYGSALALPGLVSGVCYRLVIGSANPSALPLALLLVSPGGIMYLVARYRRLDAGSALVWAFATLILSFLIAALVNASGVKVYDSFK